MPASPMQTTLPSAVKRTIATFLWTDTLYTGSYAFYTLAFALYAKSTGSLSTPEIAFVIAIRQVVNIVAELFFGAFADVAGNRVVYGIASFLLAASYLLLATPAFLPIDISRNYLLFNLAAACNGASFAAYSGSHSTWLLRTLRSYDHEPDLLAINFKAETLRSLALLFMTVLVFFVCYRAPAIPVLIAATASVAAFTLGLLFITGLPPGAEHNGFLDALLRGTAVLFSTTRLFALLAFSLLYAAAAYAIAYFWTVDLEQPIRQYLQERAGSPSASVDTDRFTWWTLGVISMIIFGSRLAGYRQLRRWIMTRGREQAFRTMAILTFIAIVVASLASNFFTRWNVGLLLLISAVAIIAVRILHGLMNTLIITQLDEHIKPLDDSHRVTARSTQSLLESSFVALGLFLFSSAAPSVNARVLDYAWIPAVLVGLVCLPCTYLIFRAEPVGDIPSVPENTTI
jgi:hypothetical protein